MYERGIHSAPHRETVALLADALQLQGITRAEFEAAARRAPRSSAEKPSEAARRDNLPSHPTSFLGRESEISRTADLLRRHRIVTLTGSGGVGKTRLALQTAAQLAGEYPGGLWFIDFSSAVNVEHVLQRVALVLQIPISRIDSADDLVAHLAEHKQLLIFDNCEHLVIPIADLTARIVRRTLNTSVLATSREHLRITGEAVSRVSTLSVPAAYPETPVDALSFPAIALFIERAQAVTPGFIFTASRIDAVVTICRRLEGIPLAIELAAARLSSLGLPELRDKLSDRFATLSMGPRDVAPRQQTLLNTIAWSYDLLDAQERSVLRALSAFPTSFTFVAGVAVCDPMLGDVRIGNLISSLADKSFLAIELFENQSDRYLMLDSTREYVRRLRHADDADTDVLRLAEWCASFAETCERSRFTMPMNSWSDVVRPEFETILAALDWACNHIDGAAIAGGIVGALRGYWVFIGRADDLTRLADDLLPKLVAADTPAIVARLMLSRYNADSGHDRESDLRAAHALLEDPEDQLGLMVCSLYFADLYSYDEPIKALRAIEQAERFAEILNLPRVLLSSSEHRAVVLANTERNVEARDAAIELIHRSTALDDVRMIGRAKLLLAGIEFRIDGAGRAVTIVREIIAMGAEIGRSDYGHALSTLSTLLAILEQDEEAREVARTVLLDPSLRAQQQPPRVLVVIAAILARQERLQSTARLFGFFEANMLSDLEESDAERVLREKVTAQLNEAFSPPVLQAHFEAGKELTIAAAIEVALPHSDAAADSRRAPRCVRLARC